MKEREKGGGREIRGGEREEVREKESGRMRGVTDKERDKVIETFNEREREKERHGGRRKKQ
jgi:uncharacterized protein YecA (UPF0149 family)